MPHFQGTLEDWLEDDYDIELLVELEVASESAWSVYALDAVTLLLLHDTEEVAVFEPQCHGSTPKTLLFLVLETAEPQTPPRGKSFERSERRTHPQQPSHPA